MWTLELKCPLCDMLMPIVCRHETSQTGVKQSERQKKRYAVTATSRSESADLQFFPSMSDLTRRIVVLGKTGAGKSSLANTIFGETLFEIDASPNSGTLVCQAETKRVNGTKLMWVDTPGFFDTSGTKKEELKSEIEKCIEQCAPGPHVFLIVFQVEKFTKQEKDLITKIQQCFSEEALKYAIVVFTRGDQLPKGMTIEQWVDLNPDLRNLVNKCGRRCHVIDNIKWKKDQTDEYRSNKFQVAEILKTIDRMADANRTSCYTIEKLHAAYGSWANWSVGVAGIAALVAIAVFVAKK